MTNNPVPLLAPGPTYSDPTPVKVGLAFSVAAPLVIGGLYIYSPATQAGCYVDLWGDGVLLAQLPVDLVAGPNFVPFALPFTLSPSVGTYVAAFGRYAGGQTFTYTATPIAGGVVGGLTLPATPGRFASERFDNPSSTSGNWYGVGIFTVTADPVDPITVVAETPLTVVAGSDVVLAATASAGDGEREWAWTQTSGATLAITGADEPLARAHPLDAGSYAFQVEVADSTGSATASVALNVTPSDTPPTPEPTATAGYPHGETVFRDRRIPVPNPYNPSRPTVPGWGDVADDGLETIELPGCYVAATSAVALDDAARASSLVTKSLYSTDRLVDVKIGDRIRTGDGFAYYVNVRPSGDINPFTGWSPGVEIPLDGEVG